MAVVYRAYQPFMERDVAIKVIQVPADVPGVGVTGDRQVRSRRFSALLNPRIHTNLHQVLFPLNGTGY